MALFKIFNNIDSGNSLPDSANKGYCYFDKNTKYFYIDIADGKNLEDRLDSAYRVPLNAANAAYAAVALKDFSGAEIHKTYLSDIALNGDQLELTRPGVDKEILALPIVGSANAIAGKAAWVPAPTNTEGNYFLRNDGTWGEIRLGAKVNGTVYDGATDITTNYWGTSRNFTIKDSSNTNAGDTVAVNGSSAITLHLPATIKANLSGNATTATTATNVAATPDTTNVARHVWFSDSNGETLRVYDDDFKYNPATNTLTGNISGLAGAAQALKTSGGTLMSYGSSSQPVYFKDGVPAAVSKIDVELITDTVGTAAVAEKVRNALSISVGGTNKGSYDGSETHHIDVNAMDLNISGALTYLGRVYAVPSGPSVTLTTGETKSAQPGHVVICIEDNNEYLFDADNTWINLGGSTSYALRPHIHGNIDSEGFLTSSLGVAQANYLVRTDGTGKIIPGAVLGSSTTKFLAENGTWQTVNTDKWKNKLTLSLGNELTGSVSFDGSESSGLSLEATIVNGKITTDKLSSGAITSSKIASNAVETAKIKDANVTTQKIADGAITAAKLAPGAITSAPKLTAARKINGVSFDGSQDVTGVFTSGLKEAYLEWGGRNLSYSFAPIDAALNPVLGANRLAGIDASGVTVEYSTDGGSTWVEYSGLTAAQKTSLFTTSYTLSIKGNSSTASANSRLRITLDGINGNVYTQLNKLHIYITSNYSNGCKVSLESYDYNSSTSWHTIISNQVISGWSGWNVLNFTLPGSRCFGGTNDNTHQRKLRLTFSHSSITSGQESKGLQISKIYGYGGVGWTTNSRLAANGVPYDYDYAQNVTFPAWVTAKGFTGSLSGNASSATKLATARTINGTTFDGTGNITTANWGISRSFTIGNTTKSVNGANNMSWSLSEIGAAASSHTHSIYLPLAGGTMTGNIKGKTNGSTWIQMTHNGAFNMSDLPSSNQAASVITAKTANGSWGIGVLNNTNNLYFVYGTDANYNAGANKVTTWSISTEGYFTGQAASASKWTTRRALSVSSDLSGSVYLDGSADVSLAATIVDNAIITKKIANGAVLEGKIADGAVTEKKIATGAVTEGKIADKNITEKKIADKNITRAKLNNDALYSPIVWIGSDRNLALSDVGKTLYAQYSASAATKVITLTQDVSKDLPAGFECSFTRPYTNAQFQIKFAGVRVVYNGAQRITEADTKSVKLSAVGSMIALKKIETNTTCGDYWLIIGEVEEV